MAFAAFSRASARPVVTRDSRSRSMSRSMWACARNGCILLVVLTLGLFGLAVFTSIGRRLLLGAGLASSLIVVPESGAASPVGIATRTGEIKHTEEEWLQILGKDSFRILRKEGTELPWSSPLNDEKRAGTFVCAGCGSAVYNMSTKYNSGTGWPSFYAALPGAVDEVPDLSIPFMPRTEIRCHKCQGHLGHVFNDGPRPTGLRYCMNGLAMKFVPDADQPAKSA